MLKKRRWEKSGVDFFMNQLIFIIIIIAFVVVILAFVTRFGNQAGIKEQIYAKQIALAIDKARPGSVIDLDMSELYSLARKNKVNTPPLKIDNQNKIIYVQLSLSKGYSYSYFSNGLISWNFNNVPGKERLYLSIE